MNRVQKKPKHYYFFVFAFVILGFFAVLTIFGDEGLLKLKQLYTLKNQLKQENFELFQTNQKLLREATHLKDPIYAERLIREKLGYIKSREYILLLPEKLGAESQAAPASPLSN
ncbi:MAG: septum formation initiator family protein [Deltaproteobacteria bacterium]|nr:septum formation initiator family protein [Deltaproteobacteria bacterium]